MSCQLYCNQTIQQSPISTHHIKAIVPNFNDSLFIPSERSISLIEKSLCENFHKQNIQILSKGEHELLDSDKKILKHDTIDKDVLTNHQSSVAEDDVAKLFTELIGKGKKIQALTKSISKDSSFTVFRQQIQKLAHSNIYMKSAAELILSEYYKKRKLGHKLRGLNMDLVAELQAKLYPLIETEVLLWQAQNNNKTIDAQFNALTKDCRELIQSVQLNLTQK